MTNEEYNGIIKSIHRVWWLLLLILLNDLGIFQLIISAITG